MNCRDCAVAVNTAHDEVCDIAVCLHSGGQRLQCYLSNYEPTTMVSVGLPLVMEEHDCGQDIWTGEWPGAAECREYDLWVRWDDALGWVKTVKEDPQAREDLNSLKTSGTWNRELQKWEVLS